MFLKMFDLLVRIWRIICLPGCWFAPASFLRVFFHRLRGVKIGSGVEIGYFVVIDHAFPNKVSIGSGTAMGPNVMILAHDDAYGRDNRRIGKVDIGKNSFIGGGTTILPGVEIGREAIVGANSLVNKDVKIRTVVGGVPIKLIKNRDEK
jgi:acetyltransferase-like isoleucine patch superfamily enzyme